MNEAPSPILYVDAEVEASHVLPRFIGRSGPVEHAPTLAAARVAIRTSRPELLVVDPDLPDGDGTVLLSEIRERVPWAQSLVVCGEAHAARLPALIAAGASDVLIKPFDALLLPARVEYLRQTMRARRVDIERTRELEARLRHADRVAMLGTLVATIAHEVASPLTAISTGAGFLRDLVYATEFGSSEREDLGNTASEIQEAARAIESFIQRVRVFSRRAEGGVEVRDLSEAVETSLVFLRSKIRAAGVIVEHEVPGDPVPVPHVPTRMTQAVTNALTNAIDAVSPGGRIVVRYAIKESEVALEIEDDGPGLPDEVRRHALEPFFTTKSSGTGLGMSVMQDVMRAHRGTLELLPGCDGKGLLVRMRLPRHTQ